ncbi:MAG: MFS transporter [bacterium]|nr:MFS transporter [bacterium]
MNIKLDIDAPFKLVVALVIGAVITWFNAELLPLTMGVLTDGYKFSLEHAGVILSVELFGGAILPFFIAPFMGKIDLRKLALIGGLVAISGQSMTAMTTGYIPVGASRFITGAGYGIMGAVLFAAVARTKDPERLMGLMTLSLGLFGAFFVVLFPYVISGFGPRAYFWSIAAMVLCTFWVYIWLPKTAAVEEVKNEGSPPVSVPVVFLVVCSSVAYFSGQTLLWTFAERIGVTLGLSMEKIGWILGGSSLTGLVGAVIPTWLGTKYGRILPLVFSIMGMGASFMGVTHAGEPVLYTVSLLGYGFFFGISFPYVTGTVAAVDPLGRMPALFGALGPFCGMVMPALGAYIVTAYSYQIIGLLCVGCTVLACLPLVALAMGVKDRKTGLEPMEVA